MCSILTILEISRIRTERTVAKHQLDFKVVSKT
jgi:hypothetical protein